MPVTARERSPRANPEPPGEACDDGSVSEPPSWSPPSGWAPEQPPPSYPPPHQPAGPQASGWQQQPGWGPGPGGPSAFPPAPPPPPKPGIIALRPLGVGEILDGAISALRTYPRIT